MDKRHLLEGESLDPASLVCVNPYEVNPLSSNSNSRTTDIPLKVESSVFQQNQDGISCGGLYKPPGKIKLEMEEFGDLSPFVSQKRISTNFIDELNTPLFDKDAFDFDMTNYEKNVQADLHVMLKYDASFRRGGAQAPSAAYQPRQDYNHNKDIFLNTDLMRRNITILPLENMPEKSDAIIYSPPASDSGTYIEKLSPNTYVFDYDMNNSVSVSLDSRNSSPYGPITPDGSEKSYNPSLEHTMTSESNMRSKTAGPKLSLDINLGQLANMSNQHIGFDVSTPNLIAEVVSLEATGFNILDLINEDSIPITTEDIFTTTSLQNPSEPYLKCNQSHKMVPVKQTKKRLSSKQLQDDEDFYVPPTKKKCHKNSTKDEKYVSSDSDSEEERPKPRKKARGRPRKRTESVSSDCSIGLDDSSRYRELRDKNNEASRKSRLKRKLKDVKLEQESYELHTKNIKLKAQVEELEKMVNNFRDNLFKIMINK